MAVTALEQYTPYNQDAECTPRVAQFRPPHHADEVCHEAHDGLFVAAQSIKRAPCGAPLFGPSLRATAHRSNSGGAEADRWDDERCEGGMLIQEELYGCLEAREDISRHADFKLRSGGGGTVN